MKGWTWLSEAGQRLNAKVSRWRYVLLVLAAGVILLLLPTGEVGGAEAQVGESPLFSLEAAEKKLAQTLSRIDGAGEVTVMLTLKEGVRQVLAEDASYRDREGEVEEETAHVVVSQGSGIEKPVAVQEIWPKFQGALVVCPGGGDPGVRLRLVEAVAALTGLGADRISICKAK